MTCEGVLFVGLGYEKRRRVVSAWICMLALTLLHAPLAGAVWAANGMDCCAGGFCPVRGHDHITPKRLAPQDAMPMDCGHDVNGHRMAGVSECSMSCGQSPEHPTIIPGNFLLPDVAVLTGAVAVARAIQMSSPMEISWFSKPLSPPPRRGASVL